MDNGKNSAGTLSKQRGVEFRRELRETRFLDPALNFAENKRISDIRFDPLTGRTARVLDGPKRLPPKPDLRALVEKSLAMGCPFCPDRVHVTTPEFPRDLVPVPRIVAGEATLFCNAFPYDAYSAVCVMTGQHFVGINEFTEQMLMDALGVCQAYIKYVAASDQSVRYCSVNWNYMPTAGASMVHPHLQILVGDLSTNHQRVVTESSRRYWQRAGSNFWADLVEQEKRLGERYIGQTGTVEWLSAYAPRGISEIIAVLPERESIVSLSADDWGCFSRGLLRAMAYLGEEGFHSFNLTLSSPIGSEEHYRVNGSIVPRSLLSDVTGTNEMNYFQVLHCEPMTRVKPEDTCASLRRVFGGT